MKSATLASWGRFPNAPQTLHDVSWRSELAERFSATARIAGETLPYGNGRSYGDSCLANSDHVVALGGMSRFMSADWQTGVIAAEAGLTLEALLDAAIPRGWFLPVTPGTKYATLGGAIANDVHGKNHHVRGTFGRHVRRFSLLRSDATAVQCSPDQNAELFCATIGGLGLTGIIEWTEVQLMPIRSGLLDTITARFDSLEEFFALSTEFDSDHEYTMAWVDCLARANQSGRGVFYAANHAERGELSVTASRKLSIPFVAPISPVNRFTLGLFNTAYFHLHRAGRHRGISAFEPFFYPLDHLLNWNRLYGPQGFQQYQCVVPEAVAPAATSALLDAISKAGAGSFLAVLKKCGHLTSPGLMSFPIPGVSLALDFPHSAMLSTTLFPRLDAIVHEAGGRLYPAKDAHMSGAHFRAFYPQWESLERLRDPLLCSRFWKRVTTQ